MMAGLGRYALYVWPAYGISALALLAMAADSLFRARRWRKASERAERERASGPR
jgi:heme exporter protein D